MWLVVGVVALRIQWWNSSNSKVTFLSKEHPFIYYFISTSFVLALPPYLGARPQTAYSGSKDSLSIPQIHLGVYLMSGREARGVVMWALQAGYRGINSAQMYRNERDRGRSIMVFIWPESQYKQEDIFFTTKLASRLHGDLSSNLLRHVALGISTCSCFTVRMAGSPSDCQVGAL